MENIQGEEEKEIELEGLILSPEEVAFWGDFYIEYCRVH